MFSRFFQRIRRDSDNAAALYGAIVAQARSPAFYAGIGVPDSVGGRFEMVVLHVILVTRRLESGGEAARAAGQGVFDRFCRDMDSSLREMGIGDLSVPKHMRRVGEAYFGRMSAYGPALSTGDSAPLADAIERTVFGGGEVSSPSRALANYALAAAERLRDRDAEAIVADGPEFPEVGPFVAPGENREWSAGDIASG
jgi:cytochrome b pre-mRNA-processing protein 3